MPIFSPKCFACGLDKHVVIFFAMPIFWSTCYEKHCRHNLQKMQGLNAIWISAKSRGPTAVHFDRLLHAVCREKGLIQIVPSSYDNVCSYSHKQLFSALLVLSDTSCVDSDSISLPLSTLLCHYLENLVYPSLPQWLSQSTLLCTKSGCSCPWKKTCALCPQAKRNHPIVHRAPANPLLAICPQQSTAVTTKH